MKVVRLLGVFLHVAATAAIGLSAGAASAGEWYEVSGGSRVPDVPSPTCVYNCPDDTATGNSALSGGSSGALRSYKPARPDMNAVVGGMIMQGVLDAVLNPPRPAKGNMDAVIAAQQQAEALKAQQAARAKAADSATFRVLQSQVDGYKAVSTGSLALKGVDDDLTAMAAQAREPFDTAGDQTVNEGPGGAVQAPTPFFGDTLPEAELRLLVEPENDPRVVDLRQAQSFVTESIKNEVDARNLPVETLVKPERTAQECVALRKKLDGFLTQREKFARTVELSSSEFDVWQKQNREALMNAATEGISNYTGNLLEYFHKRGAAADRLLGVYAKHASSMAKEGVDVAVLAQKIQVLKNISTAGQLASLSSQGLDWSGFMKNGFSALISGLSTDNAALEATLADPRVAKYFESEMPALKAALDLTRIAAGAEVFGKWAARKMPVIAGCEYAVNQAYNALDWALSFRRIVDAHRIYGNALETAKGIQSHIHETRLTLNDCN